MANFQLGDNQKVSYQVMGLDSNSAPASKLPAGDLLAVVSSDLASMTVVPDATPVAGSLGSGFIFGGSKLQTGVILTASANKADGSDDTAVAHAVQLFDIISGPGSGGIAASLNFVFGTPVLQAPGAPLISGFSPASGAIGDSVTVNGSNFGASQGKSTLTIGGITPVISSWSDTNIVFIVPAGTAVPATLILTVGGLTATATPFVVTPVLLSRRNR